MHTLALVAKVPAKLELSQASPQDMCISGAATLVKERPLRRWISSDQVIFPAVFAAQCPGSSSARTKTAEAIIVGAVVGEYQCFGLDR